MANFNRSSRKTRNAKRKALKPRSHPRIEGKGTRVTRRQGTKSPIRQTCNGRSARMRRMALREMGITVTG